MHFFLIDINDISYRVNSTKSLLKEITPTPEVSRERHASMTAAASTNTPNVNRETYGAYTNEEISTPGPYSQASIQDPNTIHAPYAYSSVHSTNHVGPSSHATHGHSTINMYPQQTSQAQGYDSYTAEHLSMTDAFYTYGDSYANSFTASGSAAEAEADGNEDQHQENHPQLQTWAEETSGSNLPVNERLVRYNWT